MGQLILIGCIWIILRQTNASWSSTHRYRPMLAMPTTSIVVQHPTHQVTQLAAYSPTQGSEDVALLFLFHGHVPLLPLQALQAVHAGSAVDRIHAEFDVFNLPMCIVFNLPMCIVFCCRIVFYVITFLGWRQYCRCANTKRSAEEHDIHVAAPLDHMQGSVWSNQ